MCESFGGVRFDIILCISICLVSFPRHIMIDSQISYLYLKLVSTG